MNMEPELKKSIIEYVLGKRKQLEISGPPRLIAVLHEAIESSRNLLSNLRNGVNSDTLKELIEKRQKAIKRYKKVTGEDWSV